MKKNGDWARYDALLDEWRPSASPEQIALDKCWNWVVSQSEKADLLTLGSAERDRMRSKIADTLEMLYEYDKERRGEK